MSSFNDMKRRAALRPRRSDAEIDAAYHAEQQRVQAAINAACDRERAARTPEDQAALDRAHSDWAARYWAQVHAEEERRIARRLGRDDPYSTLGT
jgi:hypothetical protein